jgi:hypothetical protein
MQKEKKPPQPPLEKKVPKEFLISLSLCEEERNSGKILTLSESVLTSILLYFTKDFEPFRSHSRVFSSL